MQKIAVRALAAFLAERGIGHAMLADRVAPRALSLAGDASKEKRDSNGVAEAEHL